MSVTQKIRDNMGRLNVNRTWGRLSDDAVAQQKRMIIENWKALTAEKPGYFWETREKTTDLALDQYGKVVQAVKVTKYAMTAFVSCPVEEGVCQEIETTTEWVTLETVRTPEVFDEIEAQEFEIPEEEDKL